jgi:hypothetical protein
LGGGQTGHQRQSGGRAGNETEDLHDQHLMSGGGYSSPLLVEIYRWISLQNLNE